MGLPIIGHLARAGFRTLARRRASRKQPEVERQAALWVPDATSLARRMRNRPGLRGVRSGVRELLVQGGAFSRHGADRSAPCLSTLHRRRFRICPCRTGAVG